MSCGVCVCVCVCVFGAFQHIMQIMQREEVFKDVCPIFVTLLYRFTASEGKL